MKRIVFFLTLLSFSLFGCEVFKQTQSEKAETAAVNKTDSGRVQRTDTNTDSLYEYFRRTWYPQVKPEPGQDGKDGANGKDGRDGVTKVVPVYVEEWGRGSKSEKASNYDSGWYQKLDSLAAKIEKNSSSKETDFITWKHMFGFGAGLVLLVMLLNWLSANFKFVRKAF
ncbi:hypothetical protein [Phnomibacter sp. MR]|uniref:hypothetical protein n=1 Tax=Phnomibacter sp. MR TaxID=3042318 RepID=UPI003A7F88C2